MHEEHKHYDDTVFLKGIPDTYANLHYMVKFGFTLRLHKPLFFSYAPPPHLHKFLYYNDVILNTVYALLAYIEKCIMYLLLGPIIYR